MSSDSTIFSGGWLCALRSDNARPGLWAVYGPRGFTDALVMQAVVDDFGNLVRVPS